MTAKAPPRTKSRIQKTDINGVEFLYDALRVAAPHMGPRTSVKQLFAFLAVARAEAMGETILLSDIRAIEDPATGKSIVDQTIQQTFAVMMEPSDREPKALGWVRQDIDPDDKRRKPLRLTDKGHEVAKAMLGARK